MSIKDAAAYFGVSDKTIRRRIKSGDLSAKQVDGRWIVEVVQDNERSRDAQESARGYPNRAARAVQTPVQPAVAPSMGEAQQLRAEIEHLRRSLARRDTQIDQLNTLLAMQTQQNDSLVAKLPNPRQTLGERLHPLLTLLRLAPP